MEEKYLGYQYDATIAAISTAVSSAGIGIVRMSGPEAVETLQIKYMLEKRISGLQNRSLIRFITVMLRMERRRSTRFWLC